MPTNTFGINDNFNLESSHFIPALIKKIHLAIKNKQNFIKVWGTGTPRRELIHTDDLADAVVFFMNKKTKENLINIGTGYEKTINQFAKLIIKISNKKIKIINIKKNLNGVKRKLLDCSLAKKYGWKPKENIYEKLTETYNFYRKHHKIMRQ